jgi:hypothetical protein
MQKVDFSVFWWGVPQNRNLEFRTWGVLKTLYSLIAINFVVVSHLGTIISCANFGFDR